MQNALRFLSRTRLSPWSRYGLVIVALALISLIRLVAPLDTAPFLLYLPVIFLVTLGLGWTSGLIGILLSDLLAAFFFRHDTARPNFSTGQVIALVEYLLTGAAMVGVCAALRRAVLDNERVMADLQLNRHALQLAKEEADRAKQVAEDASKAKSAFLANMSHELRTPLSAVIGYSEMLEEEVEDLGDKTMLADIGKIKSNAKHLLSLINDVLDLSKVEANKMDIYVEPLEVARFAQDVASAVESLVQRKRNTLTLDVAADIGSMRTDIVKLRQCLFNLLSNAAKFTEAGRITLSVRREADAGVEWLSFAVSDTGIGMTPEQLQRLFQRFMQADETTTRQFGGTGLGLALSQAFAQLLGGSIVVQSAPGQGTCFTLRLPAAPAAPAASGADAAGAASSPDEPTSRDLVLIIDDEAAQRELMTRFLERRGYTVRSAANGPTGLDLAAALQPRVILLDVMMPDMDGWSVLAALKQRAETAAIPVVMVSFVADPALSEALGAADALPKPLDWARLETTLTRLREVGGNALVVDDDADTRQRLRTVLERAGWSAHEATNGAEALLMLKPVPDLILLDLTMPVMDGFSFLHRLRETAGCADIPVIVLSARDITPLERDQLASADNILKKGETSMSDLQAEVRHVRDAKLHRA